ncbi:MAG: QcrA and Rieske domain-containing protein [Planctomycetota bacterium]
MIERHIPYSLVERRSFLGRASAIVGAGFLAQVVLPLWRYLFPGMSREPDKVEFTQDMLVQLNALGAGECFRFKWGGVPGLALRARDGELRVFKGVCTHADCNVAWRSGENDFFCACHDGRYDEFGRNIEGPPPRPLTRLFVTFEGNMKTGITELTIWRSESVWLKKGEDA